MTNWWQGESKNVQPIPTPTAAPTTAPTTAPTAAPTVVVTPDPILEKYKNVTGGDIKSYLYNSKNYRLHIFSNPGTFIFTVPTGLSLSIDYILVGGGGGGAGWGDAYNGGGGGGGGQVLSQNFQNFPAGQHRIQIGKGGIGIFPKKNSDNKINNGESSKFEVEHSTGMYVSLLAAGGISANEKNGGAGGGKFNDNTTSSISGGTSSSNISGGGGGGSGESESTNKGKSPPNPVTESNGDTTYNGGDGGEGFVIIKGVWGNTWLNKVIGGGGGGGSSGYQEQTPKVPTQYYYGGSGGGSSGNQTDEPANGKDGQYGRGGGGGAKNSGTAVGDKTGKGGKGGDGLLLIRYEMS